MAKIICGIPGCQKCKMAKEQMPDAKYIEFGPDNQKILLDFCRTINVSQMPLIITTGDDYESIIGATVFDSLSTNRD